MRHCRTIAALAALALAVLAASAASGGQLLIPMDLAQADHLRAYGVVFNGLERGATYQWLLNYRGGSFLTDDASAADRCRLQGVSYAALSEGDVLAVMAQVDGANMERIELEKAPRLAVYVPPTHDPWDDAVRLALDYAGVPYATLWDEEVLAGALSQYDWLHLHHEDFTGQYGKFYAGYRSADWYKNDVRHNQRMADRLGYAKVSRMKLDVARRIRRYLEDGGFLFAMCSAPATLDIALAAAGTDIVPQEFDGDPADPRCQELLDYSQALAFTNFEVVTSPLVYEHSDIDATQQAAARGQNTYFSLFDFSAKYDPVSCMLVQDHVGVVREFMGQDTGFRRERIKPGIVVLAEVAGSEEVKYLHGIYGRGSFAFYGGHDPEDFQHMVGDPRTDLRLFRNSPGYRLILNNILFPAAKKKPLKT